MLGETDVRNKDKILKRKSVYSQLQQQLEQMGEALKDKEGTIENLSRQLVQAGIKVKIQEQDVEVRKDTLETKAQQKLYRNVMKKDFDQHQKQVKENSRPKE